MNEQIPLFPNPYRPGAGHDPPHLAGRDNEQNGFARLLDSEVVLENPLLTGLRGVGKTVLLNRFKSIAQARKWLWVGTDLSESASVSESNLAARLLTDIAPISSSFTIIQEGEVGQPVERAMDYEFLDEFSQTTAGLVSDKLKAVLEIVHKHMPPEHHGIVFAYDEAQNLADHAAQSEYPLSVLLEVFQSIQRKNIPFMLLLTGLPTLFPKLVQARTYAERMFRVMFLERLGDKESEEAIRKPLETTNTQLSFSDESVELIKRTSGGYPYFIQFICREVYDVFFQQMEQRKEQSVPLRDIIHKLDTDFFAGRWTRATDRQRDLLRIIASLETADHEFTVKQIVQASKDSQEIQGFSSSLAGQMLADLADAGLVYRARYGKYALAVPLLYSFIRRQST